MDKKELAMALKDMSDEEILALIHDARKLIHTGYEQTDDEWFYLGVDGDIHKTSGISTSLYNCANYYSDINVARECSRADTLMRKLRRFAAEHGGCVAPCGPIAWCITYDYQDEAFKVEKYNYDSTYTPGMVLFKSEQAAKDAIDEFADELDWYFNYYDPMAREWERAQ
jgi:hypothetical protein